jgi:hypothetical protein
MTSTYFFACDACHVECRIDSESARSNRAAASGTIIIVQHCPKSEGVAVDGKVTGFQERRGGVWVNVQRWIYAA